MILVKMDLEYLMHSPRGEMKSIAKRDISSFYFLGWDLSLYLPKPFQKSPGGGVGWGGGGRGRLPVSICGP